MQTLAQALPTAEMGTAHTENTVTNTTNAALPTREELAATAYDLIQFWMESGHSQLLSRKQALQIAVWGLKIAGEQELQHTEVLLAVTQLYKELLDLQVLAELVELPENYN